MRGEESANLESNYTEKSDREGNEKDRIRTTWGGLFGRRGHCRGARGEAQTPLRGSSLPSGSSQRSCTTTIAPRSCFMFSSSSSTENPKTRSEEAPPSFQCHHLHSDIIIQKISLSIRSDARSCPCSHRKRVAVIESGATMYYTPRGFSLNQRFQLVQCEL